MRDPLNVLNNTDQPQDPRPRFAAELKQRLEEAAMTNIETNEPFTGGVSNLFYFTLPAPDLDRSKTFYTRVFQWTVDGGSLGGHISSVTPAGGLNPTSEAGDRTVYITVDNIDVAIAKVVELGGAIEGDVQRYDTGASVSCTDDQGTRFELQEPAAGDYQDYARNPQKGSKHGDLFYFSLPVADGDKGRRFYRELFNWDFGEAGSQGGMNAQNLIVDGGIGARRDGDRVEFWFRVDDIEETIAEVRAAGGTASEPMDTPQGMMAACTDDQGVDFGLAQPAPGF